MKEVKLCRYAGPFKNIPFKHFIQSPIGLVPKDGGKATRLIFHLSYPRLKGGLQKSLNANTPRDKCAVTYADFDQAVHLCLQAGEGCAIGKSDVKSAFRNLCIKPDDWMLLVMKAQSPIDQIVYYFVDKCLPFGASISCAHFQEMSDAIAHIFRVKSGGKNLINYLDDYFFAALLKIVCDQQINLFLNICKQIKMPISLDKTFWGTNQLIFLSLLIDTVRGMVFIPQEKLDAALKLIQMVLKCHSKKITLEELQKLCGMLNFFTRCIVPARTFTRRLYSKISGNKKILKSHHHINVDSEMRLDLELWLTFLCTPQVCSRKFAKSKKLEADEIDFYSDSSKNPNLGCGGVCEDEWFVIKWDHDFIIKNDPSINYLELYALTVSVFNWIYKFEGKTVALFCDNMSVVHMVNTKTSSCKQCMILIRLIVLKGMQHNVNIMAKHVTTKNNYVSDCLSRLKLDQFRKATGNKYKQFPTEIPEQFWPMDKVWASKNHTFKKKHVHKIKKSVNNCRK